MFSWSDKAAPVPARSSGSSSNAAAGTADEFSWALFGLEVVKFGITIGVSYYLTTKAMSMLKTALDSTSSSSTSPEQALLAKKALAKRLKRPEVETMSFDAYELRLLTDVIGADEITVSFDDIGGLDVQIEEVKDNIVLPIQLFHHTRHMTAHSHMATCPTGMLLYGRPGTGKSLLAKAIAKESGATFVNIKASSLTDKWFGESDHLVSGLFSLARKLAPSVVFIDEIETLLKKRGTDSANPALHSMQGVFLSEWDGLTVVNKENASAAERHGPVLVLGATNRPSDLDAAFLRRMPMQIQTKVPDCRSRYAILKAQLKKETLGEDVDLWLLAELTEGYTGSDIRELVRIATLQRTKEMTSSFRETLLKSQTNSTAIDSMSKTLKLEIDEIRPLCTSDFYAGLQKTREAVAKTAEYNDEVREDDSHERLARSMELMEKLLSLTNKPKPVDLTADP